MLVKFSYNNLKRKLIHNFFAQLVGNQLIFLNGHPRPLFHLFLVFSNKQYNLLQQINVKKYPSSVLCCDSNSQPSDYLSLLL